jgi:D-xylose transport system substrate-binding protein
LSTKKLITSIIAVAAIVTGCSSSTATATTSATSAPSAAATCPPPGGSISISSFDSAFCAMSQLTSVTSAGSGLVGVILPDVTTSARYTSYDLPYLTQAFKAAGYATTDFKIDNASGTTSTEVTIAQADITAGAKVLLVDPLDGPTGKQIQSLAQAAGIPYISYDRATFQGTSTYYVSFDNVQVGKLIGQGFMDCVTAWNVASPQVYELDGGEDTDPNAISFAAGYNNVIWGTALTNTTTLTSGSNSAGYTLAGDAIAPGWDNTKGQTIFQTAFTANNKINATVEANDGLANSVITVLKGAGVAANKIPTTGQDATLQGMENVLQGFQCGSVYKPIYKEAQAAVALATYLRAKQTPPTTLVNGTTTDPTNAATTEPAVLLIPTWVNSKNMESTVIQDKFVSATDLCNAVGASVCSAAGIQ